MSQCWRERLASLRGMVQFDARPRMLEPTCRSTVHSSFISWMMSFAIAPRAAEGDAVPRPIPDVEEFSTIIRWFRIGKQYPSPAFPDLKPKTPGPPGY